MLASISFYERSSTFKFVKDVIEITEPLKKIGIIRFYYAELLDSQYISSLVKDDQMMREFIKNARLR